MIKNRVNLLYSKYNIYDLLKYIIFNIYKKCTFIYKRVKYKYLNQYPIINIKSMYLASIYLQIILL